MAVTTLDLDTGDPDQNLANAIVAQAVTEWREIATFLRDNPLTAELAEKAWKDRMARQRAVRKWKEHRQKAIYRKWHERYLKCIRKKKIKRLYSSWRDIDVVILKKVEKQIGYTKDELYFAEIRMKQDELKDLEAWFHSHRYEVMTNIDPDFLLRMLRKELNGEEIVI